MRRALLLALLALLSLMTRAQAQSTLPPKDYALNLKGVLYNNNGTPVADNNSLPVTFKLYNKVDRNDPALPVFQETQNVKVFTTPAVVLGQADRKGKYAVTLGVQNTGGIYNNLLPATQFSKTLYLEIWVNNQQPLPAILRVPILQVPADSVVGKSMNQIVWVTNALNHVENANAIETAALAFFVNKTYAAIPNADPNFVTRSLIKAQDSFNRKYRDSKTGQFRTATLPLDAVINMYSVLIQQPGNPVVPQTINESLTFAAGTLDNGTHGLISSTGNTSNSYQQFSYELNRMAASANFNQYTSNQFESLYLLARQNANAALVVNTFFGYGLRANTGDNLFTVLDKNPDLRDSANFAPLRSQIEADGTMLSTIDTAEASIADFYDRMTLATNQATAAQATITLYQKPDYTASITNNITSPAVVNALQTAQDVKTGPLQGATASTYATITLMSEAGYDQLLIAQASMTLAANVARTVADSALCSYLVVPGQEATGTAALLSVPVDALNTAAASIGVALATASNSPTSIIQDGLNQLSAQLQGVQQQLNNRLDIVDANIANLYTAMDAGFRNLNVALQTSISQVGQRVDELVSQVVKVQYTLDHFTQNFSDFATASTRASLVTDLTEINNWYVPGVPAPSANEFNRVFSYVQSYATSTVLQPPLENGNKGNDGLQSSYGDADIVSQLDSKTEKNLTYLVGFAANRFYNQPNASDREFTKPNSLAGLTQEVANPISWELSCLGLMRAATYGDGSLGLPYIQASQSAFDGAFAVGKTIQDASNHLVLQYHDNSQTTIDPSPILPDMLIQQRQQATAVYNALFAAQGTATDPLATRVQRVLSAYNDSNSDLTKATQNLNGSRRLLEQFFELGLSRSVKSNQLLGPLLYSRGDVNYRDAAGNLAFDPNAQMLPDGDWVQSQYHNWIQTVANAPASPSVSVGALSSSNFLKAGTYYVVVTTLDSSGNESLPSAETAPVTVSTGQDTRTTPPTILYPAFIVASPSGAASGAVKYRVYVGQASGGPYYLQNQNGEGFALGTNYTLSTVVADVTNGGTLYHAPVQGTLNGQPVDPLQVFFNAQSERWTALNNHLNTILTNLADNANLNQMFLGEPLGSVEAIESRLGFFLIPTVSGTVVGAPIPSLAANAQPKSLANTAVTMTFNGINNQFAAPVLLDVQSKFTVYAPKDTYLMFVKAPSFLQNKAQAPGQVFGFINTLGDPNNSANDQAIRLAIHNVTATLTVGDVTGDNIISNPDLILIRNALGSFQTTAGWDGRFDLNGDGAVDWQDQKLLMGSLYTTSSDIRWNAACDFNGDGKVDDKDTAILTLAFGSLKADPANGGNPSANWNAACDLNGDGIVDWKDQEILQGKVGTAPGAVNWDPRFDFNGSGSIDVKDPAVYPNDTTSDSALLRARLGTRKSSLNWNPLADLNGDGKVDMTDFNMARASLGQRGQ